MSGDRHHAVGEAPRLRGEDESGGGSGRRDVAGLAIAIALFALAFVIVSDASSYPIRRSYAQFGPEIVPYIVATGIVVLGALTVVMALRGGFESRPRLNYEGLIWIVGAVLLEIAMLHGGSGFIPASAVLFGFAARAFGQKTLLLNLAVGAVVSTLLFLLFRYGLGLALPSGYLERFIDLLLR